MEFEFPTTAGNLGRCLGAEVIGDEKAQIEKVAPLDQSKEACLTFLADKKYARYLDSLRGAVVITTAVLARKELSLTYLIVPQPKLAFARVAQKFIRPSFPPGISTEAVIHSTVQLGENVSIGPLAVISEGAKIGAGCMIYPQAFIGCGVEMGSGCSIYPGARILDGVRLGKNVKIFSGSVIGSDGFGYLSSQESGVMEIPQLGTVVIEDDVRIGANCTIDRGTLGETRIGRGTKLDDQVHVGHNCRIGNECLLCAEVGLSGSVILEDNVILAGQVGVADHVRLEKGVIIAAQSGVMSDLKKGSYFMTPAQPHFEALRMLNVMRKLPELSKKIKDLEKKLNKET